MEEEITRAIKTGGPMRTNLHRNPEVIDFLNKLPFEQQVFWAYKIDGNFEIWKMILSNTTLDQILYCHKNYNHAMAIGISIERNDFMEYLNNLSLEEGIKYAHELERDQVWEIIKRRKDFK